MREHANGTEGAWLESFEQRVLAAQARRHELFISGEVIRELAAPGFLNGTAALELVRGLPILDITQEVGDLAEILVRERVMPAPSTQGDAIHVAAATVYAMNYLLTWNVRHLANPNKRTHFGVICMRLGFSIPLVYTPDMLQENDDE